MYAILVAAYEISKQAYGEIPIRILSDSHKPWAIRPEGAWKFTSLFVNDCRIWIEQLAQRRPVILKRQSGCFLGFFSPESVLKIPQGK